jgi:hypothetical protein
MLYIENINILLKIEIKLNRNIKIAKGGMGARPPRSLCFHVREFLFTFAVVLV